MAPAFLDIFERDVGGHAGGEVPDGLSDFLFVPEVVPAQAEGGEQLVEVDPCGHGIVEREAEFVFFARHGEAFDKAWGAIDAGEASTAVLEAAGDHFERKGGLRFDVPAEQCGVEIGSQRIDIVQEEVLKLWLSLQQGSQLAIAEQIGEFVPVTGRVEALEREVIGIVRRLAGFLGPAEEGAAEAVAHFLLLEIEYLLRHFLPCEAQIADRRHHAQPDGSPAGKNHLAFVAVVILTAEEIGGWFVRQVAGGEDVWNSGACESAGTPALGEMNLDEGTVAAIEFAEGMESLADACSLGPAAACAACQRDDGDFAGGEGCTSPGRR